MNFFNAANSADVGTTRVFRDTSGWNHLILAWDTTQGTDTDRWKLFLNNANITSTLTGGLPAENQVHYLNQEYGGSGSDQNKHQIARQSNSSNYSDMYVADFAFVDGLALTPSYFGEADSTSGIWKPKEPDVTWGNSGFFLEFKQTGTSQNSSGIGADTSGNDNHFKLTTPNIFRAMYYIYIYIYIAST